MTVAARVRLLTGADLEFDDTRSGLSAPRPRALFVLLALNAGARVSRDRLCDYLWPYTDQSTARQRLRMALLNMKRGLSEDLRASVRAEAESIMLDIDPSRIDALRFMTLADAEDTGPRRAAIALYGGDLLAQSAPISDVFDRYLEERREEFRTVLLGLLHGLMREQMNAGESAAFERTFRRALQVDGANGGTTVLGMGAAAAEGQARRVQEIYDAYSAAFRERFGADPPEDVRAACASFLAKADSKVPEPSGAPPRRVRSTGLTELRAKPRVALRLRGGRARIAAISVGVLCAAILIAGGLLYARTVRLDPGDGEVFLLRPDGPVTGDCGAESEINAIERALVDALQQFEGSNIVLGAIRHRMIGEGPGIFEVGLSIACLEGSARATITIVNTGSRGVAWIGRYDLDPSGTAGLSQRIFSEMEAVIRP